MKTIKRKHRGSIPALVAAFGLVAIATSVTAATIPLAPLVYGKFVNGNGANTYWAQVGNDWQGPSDFSQNYGGISTLEDAQTVLGLAAGDPALQRSVTAVMPTIDTGNDMYNQLYAGSWGGPRSLPPLFTSGDPNQENYLGHAWGYIAVPKAGMYNFDVLYDDGFKFTLQGKFKSISMSVDGLNPRDHKGFENNLKLGKGLYRFDLLGYNRLEVAALSLGWWQLADLETTTEDKFEIIQQKNLYTYRPGSLEKTASLAAVPLPGAVWLFGTGIIGMAALARRRRS